MKKLFLLLIAGMFPLCSIAQSITLSPSAVYPFTVKTGGNGAGFYGDISTSGTSGFQYYYVSSTSSSLGTGVGDIFGSASRFGLNSNSSLILRCNSLDRMTITSTGSVGIGTSTPLSNLDVLGTDNWNLGGGSNGDFRVGTNAYNFRIGVAQGGGGAGTVRLYAPIMIFGVGTTPADKVYFTSGGLGVGAFPTYALEAHPNAGNLAFGIYSSDNAHRWEHYVTTAGNMQLYADNIYVGTFNPTTGVYSAISDKRLKTNINSLGSILDKVVKLVPSTYEYIANNPANRKSIGLLAQDVENIFPEFVYKNTDDKTGKEIYTLDYAGMSVIALKAIQELQVKIQTLETELLKLKK